jgi:hypothetical protein
MIGFNGGLIGKNNPTAAGLSIPGVWTAREQEVAVRRNEWASAVDSNFSNVTLLLHGDGANNSTTFIDSSPSPRTVVANGNAKISTGIADPFSNDQRGVMAFDGTGDYLTSAANAAFDLGSSNFTIELWCNFTSAANFGGLICKGTAGDTTAIAWSLEFNDSSNNVRFYLGGGPGYILTGTSNLRTANTWQHVAVCRSGNNTRLFVGGIQEGSTYTSTFTNTAGGQLTIGTGFFAPATSTVNGYIDEVRITKAARYTAAFATPTAPFPNQ